MFIIGFGWYWRNSMIFCLTQSYTRLSDFCFPSNNRVKSPVFPLDQVCSVKFSKTENGEVFLGKFIRLDYVLNEEFAYIFIGKGPDNKEFHAQVKPLYGDPTEIIVKEDDGKFDYKWDFYD
jgi:hypothetical protein